MRHARFRICDDGSKWLRVKRYLEGYDIYRRCRVTYIESTWWGWLNIALYKGRCEDECHHIRSGRGTCYCVEGSLKGFVTLQGNGGTCY